MSYILYVLIIITFRHRLLYWELQVLTCFLMILLTMDCF